MTPDPFPYRNFPLAALASRLPELTPAVLRWVPPGGRHSIGWLLAHIIGSEDFWIHRLAYGAPVARAVPTDDAAVLLEEYRRVRAATDERLRACTPTELARLVPVPEFADGWRPPCPPTVHWVFHHVFEHENYHLGQVSMLLRIEGLMPLPF